MHTYDLETQNPKKKKVCLLVLGAWVGIVGTHKKILATLESNFEVDSLFH